MTTNEAMREKTHGMLICADADFLGAVQKEVNRARKLWPGPHDPHHAYAIIKEELDEFWEEVRKKQPHDHAAMRKELIQLAAMAQRAVTELRL